MTIGLLELVIIIAVIGLVIAFAFRSGYTRGRGSIRHSKGEESDADKFN